MADDELASKRSLDMSIPVEPPAVSGAPAAAAPPQLYVHGVTLQYKTKEHLVTATYRVDFQV